MTDDHGGKANWISRSLLRDVLVIALTGAALGVGYNALLAMDNSAGALPWIRTEPKLARLEDVLPAAPSGTVVVLDSSGAASAPVRTPAPVAATTPAGEAAAMNAPAKPPAGSPGRALPNRAAPAGQPGVTPPAGKPAATTPASTPPVVVPATSAPAAAPATDVPVIPLTREPLEAGLDVVRRLYAARAAVFVDARSPEEFAEGHIAGAVSLPFDDVFKHPELIRALDTKGLPIVAYCGGGDCELARSLAFSLIDGGHKRVLVFRDGFPGWTAAGLPAAKGGAQ